MSAYEPVIGLEVHAELSTTTKIFCGCRTEYGAAPNTQVCPVCLGLPGVLPVLNRRVVEFGLRAALAFHCKIVSPCIFERKNYYYPDLPKNFQISQKRRPLGRDGRLDLDLPGGTRRVGLTDVHLEEDTAKLLHPTGAGDYSLVDFNRSGVPLLEIVGAPDLRTLEEVEAYMEAIRETLLYLEISDCRMERGSLRFEASISLRPAGAEEYGVRVEIKNLNSFRSVLGALAYEISRQTEALERGETIQQETRLWDDARGVSEAMRAKEGAQDYRYFPEPDLTPLTLDADWIARVRATLPELPAARRARFVAGFGLSDYDAGILVADKALANFFDKCVSLGADPKAAANWLTGEFRRHLRQAGIEVAEARLTAEHLVALLRLLDAGDISLPMAKTVFQEVFETGGSPDQIVAEKGLAQIRDEQAIGAIVDQVIAANPKVVADYLGGKDKSLSFLMGQVMRASQGRANPQLVDRRLREKLKP